MTQAPPTIPLPDDATGDAVATACTALVAALERGGVVALPTETVYGLAARADRRDALTALVAAKGIESPRAFTWHVGSTAALADWDGFGARARRLAARYWPGPLTLVLPGVPAGLEQVATDGWTGVRLPAQRGTAAVLAACNFPVVATSANATGEPPLLDARAIAAAPFAERLKAIADGGTARLGEASTVLAIGPGRFDVLREGVLARDELARTSGRRIAFVCTGNTCRSPMARAIASDLLARAVGADGEDELRALGFAVDSFGVAAAPGSPASAHALTAMERRGLDLSRHASTPASPEALGTYDEIFGLTTGHVQAIGQALPPRLAERVAKLDPGGRDVADPVGGSLDDYLACADQIEAALRARLSSWV